MLLLPPGPARHVQVLRLQPGDMIQLFNAGPGWDQVGAEGGEYSARITEMGRSHVQVQVESHMAIERQPFVAVHLLVGMPANERMDWLVEKATELGVASIQPLMTERSVVRLTGDRADKKTQHWQSVAIAACEQCGGNIVPIIHPVTTLPAWIRSMETVGLALTSHWVLSLRDGSTPLRKIASAHVQASMSKPSVFFLSGPEGGLSGAEEEHALRAGFAAASLGPRTLRAETAALSALTMFAI